MRLRNTVLIFCISLLFIFHSARNMEAASPDAGTAMVFEVGENRLAMQAVNLPLGDILEEMRGEYFSEISGLDHRSSELITLKVSGNTVEDILKKLLKHIDENNYAFEFANDNLKKVSVFPRAQTQADASGTQEAVDYDQDEFTNVARVHSIIEGSQAETVGLAINDIIIKYDGSRVNSSMGLIREVRRKSDLDQIEMIVVREGIVLPFIVRGGLIGVRITTTKIPVEEFISYD